MSPRPSGERRRGLVPRFAVSSLIAFLAVGTALAWLVAGRLRSQYERFAEFHAVFVTKSVLGPHIEASDLHGDADPETIEDLERFIREHTIDEAVVRLTIWSADGMALAGDGAIPRGTRSQNLPALERARTSGAYSVEAMPDERPATRGLDEALYVTYLPLPAEDGDEAIVQVVQSYAGVDAQVARFFPAIAASIAGGLLLLYALLLPIVQRTGAALSRQSRKVEEQAAKLEVLLAREQETVRRLRELNSMRNQFVSTTSHELRTPLTAILGFARTLQQPGFGEDTAIREELLGRMVRQGERLLSLIEQLLRAARLEEGAGPARREPFDLDVVVRGVIGQIEGGPERVALEIPEDLAPLISDHELVQEVLFHLLTNGLRFSGSGVTVGAARTSEAVELWVQDRGPGMTREEIARAFEPFVQGDGSNTREHGGFGLGLYLVRLLVEVLGGSVDAESEAGRGTRFTVSIPAGPAADGEERIPVDVTGS